MFLNIQYCHYSVITPCRHLEYEQSRDLVRQTAQINSMAFALDCMSLLSLLIGVYIIALHHFMQILNSTI